MPTLPKAWAFVKRDFLQNASYRLNSVFQLLGVLFSCLTFFFFSRFIQDQQIETLAPYGGKYFPFALVGIAFYSFLGVGLQSLSDSINTAQTTGTLEALLVTPTGITTVIFSSTLFDFLFATVRVLVYFLFGALFFGVGLDQANLPAAIVVLALSTACFTAMGMLSAAFVMIFKRGNMAGWVFGGVSSILGGVIFPVASLPSWLQPVSQLLPITHSLEAMRLAMLMGANLLELWRPLGALVLFATFLLPAGVLAFSVAVRRAKRTGSLVQY